jgi:hypothetical protein
VSVETGKLWEEYLTKLVSHGVAELLGLDLRVQTAACNGRQ